MPTIRPSVISILPNRRDVGILGCINEHDGTGFLHALLWAYHPGYSRQISPYYRVHLAKSIRIGALPSILRQRYGDRPLCAAGCAESRSLFNKAIAYGSPLPEELNQDYAKFLGASYRLYDADLRLIESYNSPTARVPCHIIMTNEDEYHLLVRVAKRDSEDAINFKILDNRSYES